MYDHSNPAPARRPRRRSACWVTCKAAARSVLSGRRLYRTLCHLISSRRDCRHSIAPSTPDQSPAIRGNKRVGRSQGNSGNGSAPCLESGHKATARRSLFNETSAALDRQHSASPAFFHAAFSPGACGRMADRNQKGYYDTPPLRNDAGRLSIFDSINDS